MSRVYQLAPSILSADFYRLGEQIQRVEKAECRWLHIDIMDGMFLLWKRVQANLVQDLK